MAQFLQLSHYTISHAWYTFSSKSGSCYRNEEGHTFGIKAIHHATNKLQLVLKAKVDEIGVDEHTIWRYKLRIVREKERRRNLRAKGAIVVDHYGTA